MSTFAATFRELVVPGLKRMIEDRALSVAQEDFDFSDALGDAWREAERRGARHLPDILFHELDAWMGSTLYKAVERAMPIAAQHHRATQTVWSLVSDWKLAVQLARPVARGWLSRAQAEAAILLVVDREIQAGRRPDCSLTEHVEFLTDVLFAHVAKLRRAAKREAAKCLVNA